MREVGVLHAKTHLSSLIEAVERGEGDVVITRHGRPTVKLTLIEPARPRPDGPALLAQAKAIRARVAARGEPIDVVAWIREDRENR